MLRIQYDRAIETPVFRNRLCTEVKHGENVLKCESPLPLWHFLVHFGLKHTNDEDLSLVEIVHGESEEDYCRRIAKQPDYKLVEI